MIEKLLPCPFCGGKANVEEFDDGSGGVLCSECGFHAAHSRELWEKWNQRREGWSHAIERATEAEAEVERLRGMVKSITGGLDEAIESNHYLEKQLESAVCDLEMLMEYPDGCNYCAHYTDENDDTQCALDKKYGAGTCSAKWRG